MMIFILFLLLPIDGQCHQTVDGPFSFKTVDKEYRVTSLQIGNQEYTAICFPSSIKGHEPQLTISPANSTTTAASKSKKKVKASPYSKPKSQHKQEKTFISWKTAKVKMVTIAYIDKQIASEDSKKKNRSIFSAMQSPSKIIWALKNKKPSLPPVAAAEELIHEKIFYDGGSKRDLSFDDDPEDVKDRLEGLVDTAIHPESGPLPPSPNEDNQPPPKVEERPELTDSSPFTTVKIEEHQIIGIIWGKLDGNGNEEPPPIIRRIRVERKSDNSVFAGIRSHQKNENPHLVVAEKTAQKWGETQGSENFKHKFIIYWHKIQEVTIAFLDEENKKQEDEDKQEEDKKGVHKVVYSKYVDSENGPKRIFCYKKSEKGKEVMLVLNEPKDEEFLNDAFKEKEDFLNKALKQNEAVTKPNRGIKWN